MTETGEKYGELLGNRRDACCNTGFGIGARFNASFVFGVGGTSGWLIGIGDASDGIQLPALPARQLLGALLLALLFFLTFLKCG